MSIRPENIQSYFSPIEPRSYRSSSVTIVTQPLKFAEIACSNFLTALCIAGSLSMVNRDDMLDPTFICKSAYLSACRMCRDVAGTCSKPL
jgi:hypothetical protein